MLSDYLKTKFFSQLQSGVMVEVGAAGPEFLSQSKPFRDIGWRCICVEPIPKFAQMHRDMGNEIYEYACSYEDKDDVNFELINFDQEVLTYESFSSLDTNKLSYVSGFDSKPKVENIKVNARKLDTILEEAEVSNVDYDIIDVEGWELEVMKGFSVKKYNPTVIVLECLGDQSHIDNYMLSIDYVFDSFDNTGGPNLVYVKK